MKLLVVSHACTAAVNQQLYAAVRQATGWDVSLVVPSNWRDEYGRTPSAQRWPTFDGELIAVPVRRPGDIILHTYRTSFTKLIGDLDPDVVYVNHEPYAAATAQVYWGNVRAPRPRSRYRRPIGFYSCQNIVKRYPPPFRWTESWVLRTSAFGFPISPAVADVCRRKGYRGRATVVPLAIDLGIYHPHADSGGTRREFLGDAAADTILLGYLGRLVPEKGLTTLMTALGQLHNLPWRLAIVGAGPMAAELRMLADRNGIADRLSFRGFVPHEQAPSVLSAFDVLVLPSETQHNWKEQFGRVLLEAMACGTPVIGSDSGEIPVIINDTGGGLTFREQDPAALAAVISQMITNAPLRAQLALAGREAVARRYTTDVVVRRMAETLGDAVAHLTTTSTHETR